MEHSGTLPIAFTDLMSALPDAVLVAMPDGRIVAANENLSKLSGYSHDELIDASIEMLVPSRDRAKHVALRAGYIERGGGTRDISSRLDIVLTRSDGVEVPVLVSLCTVPHADEQVIIATIRDASARREAELAVERERAFLAALNDVSSVLLDDANVDDTLRVVTQRARTFLDADLAILLVPAADDDEALEVRIADGLAARALLGSRLPKTHSLAGSVMREGEATLVTDGSKDPRLFRPPGWPVDIGATLVVPLQARGETMGTLTIAKRRGRPMFLPSDVTFMRTFAEKAMLAISFANTLELEAGKRTMQIAAARSEEELELQREMFVRLEALSTAKSDFVSRISHELRTPLTGVIGYVELLMDHDAEGPPSDERRMLHIVDRNTRRLLSLVENLLTFADVEAGSFELSVEPVDLVEVIEHVRDAVMPAVVNAQIQLIVALGPYLQLDADEEQLERAILNVVSNSVKFTPPGGSIEISSRSDVDEIAIVVKDTGFGIPQEEQPRLFTKFFRSSRSDERETPGTGLGLYIVGQIIDRHDGSVQVLSSTDGTTVTMRLPIKQPAAAPA